MSRKVLIVEDDLPFVTLIQLALRDMNFEFDIAKEGKTALSKLACENYDLVISDYRIPEIHGLDIIKTAKKRNPQCQAGLISAAAEDMMNTNLDELNLLGYMQKPFSPIEFRSMVETAF
ncbi:MAG: response regulator [bacterium]